MGHPKNTNFIDELNAEFGGEETADEQKERESASREDFGKMLGESFKKGSRKLSVGDKIRGKILVLGREDVFVSTGSQHDGVIPRRELLDESGNCPFKVDDEIELYVAQVRGGEIRLSRKASGASAVGDIEDAFDMMLPIQGRIVEVCKGGVRVNIKGKLAFCPISQIDTKRVEDAQLAEEYVGKSFEFKITQFSEGGRNIVVSRRKLLEEEQELNLGSFLEEHKDGEIVAGKVARLEKFGAFVELAPGVDGLVHISEMAWSRIGDPSELVQPGQEVTVKILKRETVNGRAKISLSMKQATDRPERPTAGAGAEAPTVPSNDPWAKYAVGQVVSGKVNRREPYGVFVQLEPGITGMLHQSKIVDHPELRIEKIKVGDSLTVQIGEIKRAERRISLEMPRDPGEDDWKNHAQQQTSTSFGTLGDAFKAALAKKKQS